MANMMKSRRNVNRQKRNNYDLDWGSNMITNKQVRQQEKRNWKKDYNL